MNIIAKGGIATAAAAGLAVLAAKSESNLQDNVHQPKTAVVIGGGIIGISTAFQLARRGVQVTVLESKSQISSVSSYKNGAILCQSMAASWASATVLAKNPGELKTMKVGMSAWMDPNFYRWAAWFWFNSLVPGRASYNHESQRQLAWYSLQCMEKEIIDFGEDVDMNKTAVDTIKVFHDADDMKDFLVSDQANFWKKKGHEFTPLTVEECLAMEPTLASPSEVSGELDNHDMVGGVHCRVDSSGDIYTYTCNLAKLANKFGVSLLCGRHVKKIEAEDGVVTGVTLDNGDHLTADVFVIAAGVASPALGRQVGVNLPVYPLKGHMATVKPVEGRPTLTRNIYSPKHVLVSPLAPDNLRIAGMVEAVGYDHTVEPDKGRKVMEKMEGLFKAGYLDMEKAEYHSCLRPVCGDDVAIIGQTNLANLYVNTGHGSKGWTFSWGSATLLAQDIMGEQTGIDIHRFSPKRFHPIKQFLGQI